MPEALTARELVAELKRRGLGTWGPAIVRRWIHEEPPLPVAERGRPGQPHRYDADASEQWLRDRERRMGRELAADGQAAATAGAATMAGAGAAADAPKPVDPNGDKSVDAVLARAASEAEFNPTVEALLDVLRGRDPRNWKAAEDAYMTRMSRLEKMGHLVNVDEMRRCLDAQLQVFMVGMTTLRGQLKMALDDDVGRAERETVIDQQCDSMQRRIASAARTRQGAGADNAA